ncbi:MAG: response regulator, partial [Sphingobium sp.]
YRVIEAHDGLSALRLIEKQDQPISLLVTDVVMPVMSGNELAEKARQIQPDLRILYTSGYTRDSISRDGRLDVGVDLVTKPFTLKTLAAKVREVLDRR